MSVLNILQFPDPRLREKAQPVPVVDDEIRRLADDMIETMYDSNGIGLAATQVGIAKRVVVIDVSEHGDSPQVFINPEIVSGEGEAEIQEGCLSVPGFYENVKRLGQVKLRALDRDGAAVELDADELFAICIQHEIDHLNGKLFVDYLSELKRNRIRKKLEKEQRQRLTDGPSPARDSRGVPVI